YTATIQSWTNTAIIFHIAANTPAYNPIYVRVESPQNGSYKEYGGFGVVRPPPTPTITVTATATRTPTLTPVSNPAAPLEEGDHQDGDREHRPHRNPEAVGIFAAR